MIAKPESFEEEIHARIIQWTLEKRPHIPFKQIWTLHLWSKGDILFEEKDQVSDFMLSEFVEKTSKDQPTSG